MPPSSGGCASRRCARSPGSTSGATCDGDGFVEYLKRSPRGLDNQSWKDSGDSMRFTDGSLAEPPIAPCEVQGYVYDAKLRTAELAREVWRDRTLAERLEREAAELKQRFDEAFWCDRGYYALALDRDKRHVDSLTSNIGHLLWSGIVPEERVEQLVDALMGEALWSGWGVRTMSTADAGYNPLAYHNGTVWPHDNSLCAAGFARYGRWAELHRVVRRMLAASRHFDHQLPEVFAGMPRADTPFPIRYPTAARPQAWAAGTPVLLLQLLLGLQVDRAHHRLFATAPELPEWAGSIRLTGVRAFERSWDVHVENGQVTVRMRVAILSPVWFPVPPTGYGGIELIVSLLADGLADAGHEVTLFASGDSLTKAELAYTYEQAPSELIGRSLPELRHALACYTRASEFDVINDHSGMPAAALAGALSTPVLHTVHGPLDGEAGSTYECIQQVAPNVGLISISLNQRRPKPDLPWAANIPNALDLSLYPCKPHPGEYLLFLGRMSPDKGAHRAIAVAMELGLPLKMAGKNRERREQQYFAEFVEPHLNDRIEWLGEVSHGTKVELLQDARATLFPIEWEEPFGLVMIESMACGTPVIATRHGAVPEVIEDGLSGLIVENYREMPEALDGADRLDPLECRRYVEERFAPERMVGEYLDAYREAVSRSGER